MSGKEEGRFCGNFSGENVELGGVNGNCWRGELNDPNAWSFKWELCESLGKNLDIFVRILKGENVAFLVSGNSGMLKIVLRVK